MDVQLPGISADGQISDESIDANDMLEPSCTKRRPMWNESEDYTADIWPSGTLILWPSDSLTALCDAAFSDCWRANTDITMISNHKSKMLHFCLWSLGRFSEALLNIITNCHTLRFLETPSAQIITCLGINTSNPWTDDVRNVIYRVITILGLIGKQPLQKGIYISKWAHLRMQAALADCGTRSMSGIIPSPPDVAIMHKFFQEQPALVRSIIVYLVECKVNDSDGEVTKVVVKQVLQLLEWSGLQMIRQMYNFVLTNKSDEWDALSYVKEDSIRLKQEYEKYVEKYNYSKELAPFGRLMRDSEVNSLNQRNYPDLCMAADIYYKARSSTFKQFKAKYKGCHYKKKELEEAMEKEVRRVQKSIPMSKEDAEFLVEILGIETTFEMCLKNFKFSKDPEAMKFLLEKFGNEPYLKNLVKP